MLRNIIMILIIIADYLAILNRDIKKNVLSFSIDSLVLHFIEYLKLTQESAGKVRSNDFEEIFIFHPNTVIRMAE